jgi:hypothetical protein
LISPEILELSFSALVLFPDLTSVCVELLVHVISASDICRYPSLIESIMSKLAGLAPNIAEIQGMRVSSDGARVAVVQVQVVLILLTHPVAQMLQPKVPVMKMLTDEYWRCHSWWLVY